MNRTRWREWAREQRLWLLGCAVLGPITFAWPAWDAWQQYGQHRPLVAIDVAAHATVAFGGAEWRLGSVEILDPGEVRRADPAPPGTVLLVAHFTMTPQPGSDPKLLASCGGRLSDDRGRRWDATYVPTALGLKRDCVAGFRDGRMEGPGVGAPWHFAQAFLIPEAAAATARPEIILPPLQPRYLRFRRR